MRILHLLSQKPEATGSGIVVSNLIKESKKRGFENFLIAGVACGEKTEYHDKIEAVCSLVEFGTDEIPFEIVGMSDIMPYPSKRFSDLKSDDLNIYETCFAAMINKALNDFKPDIVHSHHLWILTSLARKIIKDIPVVATCHGTDLRQLHLCPSLRNIVLSGCRELDYIMALSKAQKSDIMELYDIPENRIKITGIGYENKIFNPGLKNEGNDILYAGKLSRAKGVIWMLEALRELTEYDWHLHIAGGGTGKEKDEIIRASELMADRVTIHGALSQKDLSLIMKKAKIFVLPSFYEGFPLVLIEALASGCLLIATELPGVKEIFSRTDYSNFMSVVPLPKMIGPDVPFTGDLPLFVANLKKAMKEKIIKSNDGLYSDFNRINQFLEEFTWTSMFNKVENIYKKALKIN